METAMQVIIRDRNEGKTTELVKWLLEGKETEKGYPGWSRVIVCTTPAMVKHFDYLVKKHIAETHWYPRPDQMHGQMLGSEEAVRRVLVDVRKATWGMQDLQYNIRGMDRGIEFAVDDFDEFIRMYFYGYLPSLITMTGELYNG